MTSPMMPNTPMPAAPAAAPAGLNAAQQMALKNLGSLKGLPPGFAPSAPAAPAGPNPAQMRQMAMARRSAAGAGPNRAKGGPVKAKPKAKPKAKMYAKGGSVSSASKRADGCATKGKTRGKFV